MKNFPAIAILIVILAIAGCTQKSAGQSNSTAAQKSEMPLFGNKADFAAQSAVLQSLNKSDFVRLFLGLYPDVKPVLTKQEKPEPAWIASYTSGSKNLTLTLNATSAEVVSSTIPIEYLKSGKYCRVNADCLNIGSSASALCINSVYAVKEGIPYTAVSCYDGAESCICQSNSCAKKATPPDKSLCASYSSNSSPSGSGAVSSGSGSVSCNSITELRVGQKATNGNATLQFVSTFMESGSYGAKFSVTSGTDNGIKYLTAKTKDYIAAGVAVSLSDVTIEIGGSGSAVATISITGMDGTCTIS